MQEQNNALAPGGNASNPAEEKNMPNDNQKEKYLREAGNIEDYPDAQDQEEAEKKK